MRWIDEALDIIIPGRARRRINRDPRYINQQCAGTPHTPSTHPLRTGYIQRSDERESRERDRQ